jgi:hypothetical protein
VSQAVRLEFFESLFVAVRCGDASLDCGIELSLVLKNIQCFGAAHWFDEPDRLAFA